MVDAAENCLTTPPSVIKSTGCDNTPIPGVRRSTRISKMTDYFACASSSHAVNAPEAFSGVEETPTTGRKRKVLSSALDASAKRQCAPGDKGHENADNHNSVVLVPRKSAQPGGSPSHPTTGGAAPQGGALLTPQGGALLNPQGGASLTPQGGNLLTPQGGSLLALSRTSAIFRPQPYGNPLVWADGRQALCETLAYHRGFQSAAYCVHGNALGMLLAEDRISGSYMDEEIVLTRSGGKIDVDPRGRSMRQTGDHKETSAEIESFRNNMRANIPIILIVADNNRQCPSQVPHAYCVMDVFHVTDVWAEKSSGVICFRYRMEKVDRTTKSWWAPAGSPMPQIPPQYPRKASFASCRSCREESKQVYQNDWICLNIHCIQFWKIRGTDAGVVAYNQDFIEERTSFPSNIEPPYPIVQALPAAPLGTDPRMSYTRLAWKGIVCPNCGRCNSRKSWDAWRCEGRRCGFILRLPQPVLSAPSLLASHEVEFYGHALSYDKFKAPVTKRQEIFGRWRISTYEIMGGNTVTHFHANRAINSVTGGAHDIFLDLQRSSRMGLQRFGLTQHHGRGEVLTNHFAVNFGMPYKYVVATESKSFAQAPPAILRALNRLNWAGQKTVQNNAFQDFNEVLAVGYFEEGAMGYHDDGEKELGPTVATLSLGCPAIMTLRMKARYFRGLSSLGRYYIDDPVLPGAWQEDQRRALNREHDKVTAARFDQLRKIAYTPVTGKRMPANGPVLLEMKLSHGDIVVMHGAEIQTYYEHMVKPTGYLRFALTSRRMDPSLIAHEHHWKGDYVVNDAARYHGI